MKPNQIIQRRQAESGNVLFLILIAVALFAALSYAVTQSTRSGAGDTASETNLISSAQLTQYPAGIRTSVVRMLIGGVAVDDLLFNSPSDFGAGKDIPEGDALEQRAVFHPQGGNATYQFAPLDVLSIPSPIPANYEAGQWFYNAEVQIQNIGLTSATTNAGNDIVAFLPYVSTGICRRMNEEVGMSATTIPEDADIAIADVKKSIVDTSSPSTDFQTASGLILNGDGNELIGQPFGCFATSDATPVNVYYHVLVER